jgi:hypothetical protein
VEWNVRSRSYLLRRSFKLAARSVKLHGRIRDVYLDLEIAFGLPAELENPALPLVAEEGQLDRSRSSFQIGY